MGSKVEDYSIPGATRLVFSCEHVIQAPMELVFDIATDLPTRLKWMEGAKEVELLNHQLNRVGTKHRCLVDKTSPVMVTSDRSRGDDTITFTETDEKRTMCSVYTLLQEGPEQTRVRVDGFLKDNPVLRVVFALLLKKKLTNWFQANGANLKQLCEALHQEQRKGGPGNVAASRP